MAAFRFRLQSVLQHKLKIEDDRKLELAKLETERASAMQRLAALDSERERVRAAISAGMRGTIDVDAVARGLRHSEWLEGRRRELTDSIATLSGRIEAKRQEVVDAMRDRKAIENLRDRDQELHAVDQLHAEQTMLDEMGTVRHHQRPTAVPQSVGRTGMVTIGADHG